jgi:dihydroorotate dehydrogenase electron transfer subunit
MSLPRRYTAEITAKRVFGCLVELELESKTSLEAEPGQFIHIRCEREGLILRRPYSLAGARGNTVSILVREVGAGSSWLCAAEQGQKLDIMGPLGKGFTIEDGDRHGLIAGGTGIAPLRFLAGLLAKRGVEATLFWGLDSEKEYHGLADELAKEYDLRLATMDGSAGSAGNVVDLLRDRGMDRFERIYACGPRGMLAAIAENITSATFAEVQVCMEERMACGVGACRGCVVPAASPPGSYLTACKDGPVFRGRELDWSRIDG